MKSEYRRSNTVTAENIAKHRHQFLRARWLTALSLLVLLVGGVWWWSSRWPRTVARQCLAVLDFEEQAPRSEYSWCSSALSEMLTTELAVGGELLVVPRETIARIRPEPTLADGEEAKWGEALARYSRSLNADYVVYGSYRVAQPGPDYHLVLDLRLHETLSGKPIVAIERTETKLFDLIPGVAAEIRAALEVRKLSSAEQESARAVLPSSPDAFRLYLDGLEKFRRFDPLAAKASLAEAIIIDPTYTMAHALLSEIWSDLGYDHRARDSAARANQLAQGLPAESHQRVEGRFFETVPEWPRAINTYRELWRRFPDNADYGLRLAEAQGKAGRGQQALATIAELRALTLPTGSDPRIDLAESAAASSLADYERQKTAAGKAIERGQALGASILVANARRRQGQAHYQLQEFELARIAFEESRRLFEEAGERRSVAEVLSELADIRYSQGDSAAAVDLYDRALVIHQETGNRKGASETENSLGFQFTLRGDLAAARAMLEDAVAIGREIGDRYNEANYLDSLVDVLFRQGELKAAEELAQRERAIFRQLGNPLGSVWSNYNLGRIALAAGDVPKARDFHDKALLISDEIADPYWTALILESLARDLMAIGELTRARRMSDDSRAIRRERGRGPNLAASQITSAEILLNLQRSSEAEALARLAVDVYVESGRPDDQLSAVVVLARTLVAQGKLAEAETALDGIRDHAATSQNPSLRLAAAMAESELLAAGGNNNAAIRFLEATVAEAHRYGLLTLELEARLAWGVLEIAGAGGRRRANALASGRRRLETLEERARELGCGLIARKAGAALATIVSLPSWIRSQDIDD